MKLRTLSFILIIGAMLGSEVSLASGIGRILIGNTVLGYVDIISALIFNAVLIINLIVYRKQIEADMTTTNINGLREVIKDTEGETK